MKTLSQWIDMAVHLGPSEPFAMTADEARSICDQCGTKFYRSVPSTFIGRPIVIVDDLWGGL